MNKRARRKKLIEKARLEPRRKERHRLRTIEQGIDWRSRDEQAPVVEVGK